MGPCAALYRHVKREKIFEKESERNPHVSWSGIAFSFYIFSGIKSLKDVCEFYVTMCFKVFGTIKNQLARKNVKLVSPSVGVIIQHNLKGLGDNRWNKNK